MVKSSRAKESTAVLASSGPACRERLCGRLAEVTTAAFPRLRWRRSPWTKGDPSVGYPVAAASNVGIVGGIERRECQATAQEHQSCKLAISLPMAKWINGKFEIVNLKSVNFIFLLLCLTGSSTKRQQEEADPKQLAAHRTAHSHCCFTRPTRKEQHRHVCAAPSPDHAARAARPRAL